MSGATWTPFWGLGRSPITLPLPIETTDVRVLAARDRNVKRRGGRFLGIVVPGFKVLVCHSPNGSIELTVPETDVPLVEWFVTSANS